MHRCKLFLIFKNIKNNKKETKQLTRLSNKSSQNLPKRCLKDIFRDFVFDLNRQAHGRVIFEPVRKSLGNGKKASTCLKKVLRN